MEAFVCSSNATMALELNYQSLKTANSVRESVSVGVLKISEIQPLNCSVQSIYTSELFPQKLPQNMNLLYRYHVLIMKFENLI